MSIQGQLSKIFLPMIGVLMAGCVCTIMSSIEKSKPNVLLDEQQAQVNCLYTLCQAKSSHLKINGLSNDEINYMIEFITTS